jgi:hypothetical protein
MPARSWIALEGGGSFRHAGGEPIDDCVARIRPMHIRPLIATTPTFDGVCHKGNPQRECRWASAVEADNELEHRREPLDGSRRMMGPVGHVVDVAIEDLLRSKHVDPVGHLDDARVERYVSVFDELPPVEVFRLSDGLLLVDGYHRMAAARRLGREVLRAHVMQGTEADALRFAKDLAIRERGLSEEEVRAAINRNSGDRWGSRSR